MTCLFSRSQRWVALIVALLVLLSGDGLHALTHCGGAVAAGPAASGHLELHAGDCQHRPHVPMHDGHQCQVCHVGGAHQMLIVPEAAVSCSPEHACSIVAGSAWFAGAASVPGVLGARAPPLLSA